MVQYIASLISTTFTKAVEIVLEKQGLVENLVVVSKFLYTWCFELGSRPPLTGVSEIPQESPKESPGAFWPRGAKSVKKSLNRVSGVSKHSFQSPLDRGQSRKIRFSKFPGSGLKKIW